MATVDEALLRSRQQAQQAQQADEQAEQQRARAERLRAHLRAHLLDGAAAGPPLGIAVSGGVDSLTLAAFAWALRPALDVTLFHATSAAVPQDAADRVARLAAERGWHLVVVDAGELDDARYTSNPENRCYFCKSHLFDAIAARFAGPIATGANLDDVDDIRPGRVAAAERAVREPFIATGFSKADVRVLARSLGLDDVAELPASPCLSSRVETGIAIDKALLRLVDDVERAVRAMPSVSASTGGTAGAGNDLRCRVRHSGLVIEHAGDIDKDAVRARLAPLLDGRPLGFAPYRRGSAFLRVVP